MNEADDRLVQPPGTNVFDYLDETLRKTVFGDWSEGFWLQGWLVCHSHELRDFRYMLTIKAADRRPLCRRVFLGVRACPQMATRPTAMASP